MLRMSTFLIIWLIIITPLLPSFAGDRNVMKFESTDDEKSASISHGLGLTAGMVGGWGFSYRVFAQRGIGFHTGFLYFKAEDESFLNIAFEPLYYVHSGRSTSLYIVGGMCLLATDEKTKLVGGIGLGISWRRYERIWSSFDLLMTRYDNVLVPLPQGSIHYIFK